jgi:hypothetical protein
MDVFSTYATDLTAEVEGRWFPIGKGAKVLVARTGNKRYADLFRKKIEIHREDLDGGTPESEALAEEMMVEILAQTILLGWEGLSYQGEAVAYSQEMAKTLLRVKDFRARITKLADSLENFRLKREEEQGNV